MSETPVLPATAPQVAPALGVLPRTTSSRTCPGSRRPSSRRSPVRPSWSWTTARPTAPATWPTGRRRRSEIRVLHRPGNRVLAARTRRVPRRARGGAAMVSRWTRTGRTTPSPAVAARAHRGRPRDLVIGSRYTRGGRGGLGDRPPDRLSRRIDLRADRAGPRPHDLTGGFKACGLDARGAVVRRHPGRRLRVPDRDDLPRLAMGARVAEVPITFRDARWACPR